MGINFDYNNYISSYRLQNIPKVDSADLQKPTAEQPQNSVPAAQAEARPEVPESAKASRIADLEDVSITFNKRDDFGTIGMDADIAKLDMDKVVSDSKRSSILSGYQTFVGPTPEQMVAEYEDGLVIAK